MLLIITIFFGQNRYWKIIMLVHIFLSAYIFIIYTHNLLAIGNIKIWESHNNFVYKKAPPAFFELKNARGKLNVIFTFYSFSWFLVLVFLTFCCHHYGAQLVNSFFRLYLLQSDLPPVQANI